MDDSAGSQLAALSGPLANMRGYPPRQRTHLPQSERSGQCISMQLHSVLRRPIGRYGNIERNDRDAF